MVDDLIQTTRYWLPKYNSDSIMYESLWSINKLLESAGSSVLCEFADKCSALAATVLHDDLLNSYKSKNEWEYAYPDANFPRPSSRERRTTGSRSMRWQQRMTKRFGTKVRVLRLVEVSPLTHTVVVITRLVGITRSRSRRRRSKLRSWLHNMPRRQLRPMQKKATAFPAKKAAASHAKKVAESPANINININMLWCTYVAAVLGKSSTCTSKAWSGLL